jgi:hypothetical protein
MEQLNQLEQILDLTGYQGATVSLKASDTLSA